MDSALRYAMKTKTFNAKKASKPLMEKKRRARINKCLDQLQSLLEKYYTNDVRKRKLEKADILEMTVKYLRNLHEIQHGSKLNVHFAEYQAGFRSCLIGVNRYLQATGNSNRMLHLHVLDRLSSNLRGAIHGSSTTDSNKDSCALPDAEARIDSRLTNEEQKSSTVFNTVLHKKRGKEAGSHCINTSSVPKTIGITQESVNLYSGNQVQTETFYKNWYSTKSSNSSLTDVESNIKQQKVLPQIFWRPW